MSGLFMVHVDRLSVGGFRAAHCKGGQTQDDLPRRVWSALATYEVWIRTEDPTACFCEYGGRMFEQFAWKGSRKYLDDIRIYARYLEQHLTLIDLVLTRLQFAGLSVNFVKARWCCPSLELVGMIGDGQGIRPADSTIAAVAD